MNRRRLQTVDILKGIAIIMVIIVHYNRAFAEARINWFNFGQMGCQIFFVISGYGIARTLSGRLSDNSGKKAVGEFYLSRFKNIAPAFYVAIFLVWLSNTVCLKILGRLQSFGQCRSIGGIICNMLFINNLIPDYSSNVICGGWYVSALMLMYLFSPVLFSLFKRFEKRKELLTVVLSGISVLLIIFTSIIFPNKSVLLANNSFGYFSVFTQFPCFCMGMLLFFKLEKNEASKKESVISFIAGALLLAVTFIMFFNPMKYTFIIVVSLMGLSTFFILNSLIGFEKEHKYSVIFKPLEKIGRKSFYVFLIHPFFAYTLMPIIRRTLSSVINVDNYIGVAVFMPVIILLSYFGAVIYEKFIMMITKFIFKK